MRLSDFLFKNVIVIDIDGKTHIGYVDLYESSADNGSNEDSIGIVTDPKARKGVELYQSEISEIKENGDIL